MDPFRRLGERERALLRPAALPTRVEPMRAVLTDERLTDPGWTYERKLDGIRCIAIKGGGWTAPRGTRTDLGALLIGVHGGGLRYAGKVGTGFTEWTRYGRLRHPRLLGLRDDKAPEEVVRE